MTLRARLALGLAIIAAVLVVPLLIVRAAMIGLHGDVVKLQTKEFRTSLALGNLRDALADVHENEEKLGIFKTDSLHQELQRSIGAARGYAATVAEGIDDSTASGTRTTLGFPALIRARIDTMGVLADREFAAWQTGSDAEGERISDSLFAPAYKESEGALKPLERRILGQTADRVDKAANALEDAEKLSIAALALALGLASIIALWLTRSISGPVQALEKGLRAVAEGELEPTLELSPKRRDEFGRLAVSFRAMSRQLAELDKLKAEFVSVASHELKTPINVILGYLQLMQEGIYGPLSPKQAEVLSTVEAQGRTLARLAGHLLDVTRFEAGGGRIEPRSVRLATLLDDLERAFHVLAVQRGVQFRVTMVEGVPDEVQWDVDRINEVMGNLLANAFKFTPAGGSVELTAAPSDDHVRIDVRDTGAGIPPAQLPHIFEKFYQADNQRAASTSGSGLGLAIAKEIVEAHRGQISCDSTMGKGTTFTLLLPTEVHLRRRTGQHRTVELEAVS